MKRRVVVTGLGVVAPNGNDVEAFARALAEGRSAVGPIRRFSTESFPTRIAAEAHDEFLGASGSSGSWGGFGSPEEPRNRGTRGTDCHRIARFASAAAAQAVDHAQLHDIDRDRAGVVMAAGFGSYDHDEVFTSCAAGWNAAGLDWSAFREQFARSVKPRPVERRTPGSIPATIAQQFGFRGPVMSVMTACAAGTQALGDAARWIRRGDADVVVAGGADSEIYPMGLASFSLLHALSTRNDEPARASRPFSASRDGFVLGEGAGVLVLEELEHARARGAQIHAEILGFGSACDSFRVTDPHPEGVGAMLAMTRALRSAGIAASDVDYLNAHGTSTPLNDKIESRAIRGLFGAHADRLAVTSTKSMIGHLTVAAGAVEAIATILSIRDGVAHPTLNLDDPDPECDLDFVANVARPMTIDVALSNSFAFGGQCASVVIGRPS